MEPSEIIELRKKLGSTEKEFARIVRTSLATLNQWEQGLASLPSKKESVLEALKEITKRLDEPGTGEGSTGMTVCAHLREVLLEVGAENFLLLLAKEKKETLPRSCWRRLAAVIPAIGLLVGTPVGALGAISSSPSVRSLLERLGDSNR